MPWVIMKTEPAKELNAAKELADFDPYVPREARIYRHGRHRKTALKEFPAIPRLIFLYTPYSWGLQDIIGRKYTLGLVRDPTRPQDDPTRPVYVIPDYQMGAFQRIINEMIFDVREAFFKKKPPKDKAIKLKSFDDLKTCLDGLAKPETI